MIFPKLGQKEILGFCFVVPRIFAQWKGIFWLDSQKWNDYAKITYPILILFSVVFSLLFIADTNFFLFPAGDFPYFLSQHFVPDDRIHKMCQLWKRIKQSNVIKIGNIFRCILTENNRIVQKNRMENKIKTM